MPACGQYWLNGVQDHTSGHIIGPHCTTYGSGHIAAFRGSHATSLCSVSMQWRNASLKRTFRTFRHSAPCLTGGSNESCQTCCRLHAVTCHQLRGPCRCSYHTRTRLRIEARWTLITGRVELLHVVWQRMVGSPPTGQSFRYTSKSAYGQI